jgi:hypothetical protein
MDKKMHVVKTIKPIASVMRFTKGTVAKIFFFVILLILVTIMNTSRCVDEYYLEIFDPYYICSVYDHDYDDQIWDLGRKEVGKVESYTLGVEPIKKYAFVRKIIYGETFDHFFILDTRKVEPHCGSLSPYVQLYDDEKKWESDLEIFGITNIELLLPDEVAKTRTRQDLCSWEFYFMKNLWGLSDSAWSIIFIYGVLALCFAINFLITNRIFNIVICMLSGLSVGIFNFLFIWRNRCEIFDFMTVAILICPILSVLSNMIGRSLKLKYSSKYFW